MIRWTVSSRDGVSRTFPQVVTASPVNTDLFAKANWNFSLIEQDFSKGIHNPSFAHQVLFNSRAQVGAITTAR